MSFKLNIHLTRTAGVLACCIVFFCCNDDGPGSELSTFSGSIDEQVFEMVQGITFVGTLPNGQTLNFSPRERSTDPGSVHYTNPGGPGFTDMGRGIIIDASEFSGSGEMTLGVNEYSFQFVWCTTFEDLRRRFPDEVWIRPEFDHWRVYFAVRESRYTQREIVSGSPFLVDDYLNLTINPNRQDRIEEGFFLQRSGTPIRLYGNYGFETDGLLSWGSAFDHLNRFLGTYTVRLKCGV